MTTKQFDVDFDDMCGPPGTVGIEVRRGFVAVTTLRHDTGEEMVVAMTPKTARAVGDALAGTAQRLR